MSVTAVSPNGQRWWLYLSDAETLVSTREPGQAVAQSAREEPVQLSQSRQKAYKWIVDDGGAFSRVEADLAAAYHTLMVFQLPDGSEHVALLDDTGVATIEPFEGGGRRLRTTILVRGGRPLVVDSRFPLPPWAQQSSDRYRRGVR